MASGRLEYVAVNELDIALSRIPDAEKGDYLTALQLAPVVVKIESDPIRFLRHANFQTAAAAKLIVDYWRRRREVFADRAFLPLTLSGNEALLQDTVDVIKSGIFYVLPPDMIGRSVLCIDPSKAVTLTVENRNRVFFYLGQVLSENENSQVDGYVGLYLFHGPKIDACFSRIEPTYLQDTFPIRKSTWHFINCVVGGDVGVLDQDLPFRRDFIFGHSLGPTDAHVHNLRSGESIVSTLQLHGLGIEGLPFCLGGEWSSFNFSQWLSTRLWLDERRYSLTKPTLGSFISRPEGSGIVSSCERAGALVHWDLQRMISTSCEQGNRVYLERAVQCLPADEKSAYTIALTKASPYIWKYEANPEFFLRTENFRVQQAAQRIASYWRLRSSTFGKHKFDALDLTGEAALRKADLVCFGSGFASLLPNDMQGCPVVCIDDSRIPQNISDERLERCIFYAFSLATENELSRTEGAILLCVMRSPSFQHVRFPFLKLLSEALPLRFKAIHIISATPMERIHVDFGEAAYFHVGIRVSSSMASRLEAYGLMKLCLPKSLGGEWGYGKFIQWQELRTRMDWQVPLGLSGREDSEAFNFPGIRPYTVLAEGDKNERTRRLAVIHSRRKRDRVLVEADILRDSCESLLNENRSLRAESEFLTDLARAAMSITGEKIDMDGMDRKPNSEVITTRRIAATTFSGEKPHKQARPNVQSRIKGDIGSATESICNSSSNEASLPARTQCTGSS